MIFQSFRMPSCVRNRGALSFLAIVVVLGTGVRLDAQETPDRGSETVGDAVDRGKVAGGITSLDELTSASGGTITYYTASGEAKGTFTVTFVRDGNTRLQTVIEQPGVNVRLGTDGTNSWHSLSNGMRADAVGRAKHFIESQTVRSVRSFLGDQDRGWAYRDKGRGTKERIVEAEDSVGKKTDYYIDDDSSVVTRLEFVTGEATDAFGNTVELTDAYEFSDFNDVEGIPTPFKVERLINGVKAEEMVFTRVIYNVDLSVIDFAP